MTRVHGTVRYGSVVLDDPIDIPDGTRVVIRPEAEDDDAIGIREDEWDDSPEGIAAWIAWATNLQPLILTAEEEAAWRQDRADQKSL